MKKEEFTALGISEELAAKAEAASQKELEGYAAKEQLDTANAENKTLKQSVADRDKQLEELRKSYARRVQERLPLGTQLSYETQNSGFDAENQAFLG